MLKRTVRPVASPDRARAQLAAADVIRYVTDQRSVAKLQSIAVQTECAVVDNVRYGSGVNRG
jgi:hypothetical protein